jgi:hypothetical protein
LTGPFIVTVPPTLPGNLMKLTISHPSAKTITSISDDHSNTWTTGATTTDSSNAETTEVRYVCGAATGTSVITVGFDQAMVTGDVVQFSYDEVSGIAASACGDGSSGSSGGQGVLNPGPITTTSNGDLIFAFGICAAGNTEYGNQAGLAMPDDLSAKIAENDFDQFMSMVHVQASAGQISPTIYANAQDVNNNYQMYWNIVAQAFKASSGAGTEPSGIQVVTDIHFRNWNVLGWNPLPSNGNAVVFSSSNPSGGYDMGNLADNYGTTYTRTPYTDAGIDPQQDSACLGANVFARDRIFSFTPDVTDTHVEIYTIAGAKNATGTGCVGTTVNDYIGYQGSELNANMVGDPVITPTINSGANSVIISTSYVGTGPPTGMCISGGIAPPTCTGQSAGVIFNSVYATGMTDGSGWYTGDPYVFFYTNSTSPRSMDYTMANGMSATGHDGAAIEILGAASGQVTQRATPAVTVAPSASSITIQQSLSATVTVGGGSGNPTPTGTVTLTSGGYSSPATTLSGGSATINIPAGSLTIGSNTVTASYAPDAASSSTYNSATGTSTSVTVTQATPVVSAWPTASVITYGQTLASSTLAGGTASVPGAFAWTTQSIAPGAGAPSESVTFTPTDAIDYSTVAGSATVTVNKATPTVKVWPAASNISSGQTLASSTLTVGTASVPGTFAWTTPATIPPAGTTAESVTFTPTDAIDYNTVAGQVSVTSNNSTSPTVSAWPAASAITFGQTLTSSTLAGGTASVSGGFAWTAPATTPGAGTPSESVTFTPTDTTDYNTVLGSVAVTVTKATPTVSAWPAAGAITYGQTLASSMLSGGTASVPGAFAWTTASTAPGAGSATQSVTFTPTDATDYNTAAGQVSVTVNKATPTVSAWPAAGSITYGQTLASSTLSGGTASVPGAFAWTAASTAPGAGTATQSVTFTPTDATDYNTAAGQVNVTVNKATPTVSAWPAAGSITYGQTLTSSTLSGGTASVPGAFAWTAASTAPGAGTPSESVTFTPTDATDYNTAAGQVSITVNKATPTVSAWPAASTINNGQTLTSSILTGGTASVPGAFAWTAPTTVPALGTSSQSVTFTPADSADYNGVTGQVSVTVNNSTTAAVSAWPSASAITYGQTLASSTLTGGTASVPGAFAWTAPGTAPSAGLPSESVTFTPTNTTQYSVVTGQVSVIVNKATPTVSAWPAASAITYGQTLASSILTDGNASVPGAFAWTTTGTVPNSGLQSGSVTFTPTDATDYSTPTHTVMLTVNPAILTVTATNVSVAVNQAIPNLTYGIAGYVNGDTSSVLSGAPTEKTTANQGSSAGTYPITITEGSLFAANYHFQFVNGTLTITGSGTTTATPAFSPGSGTYSPVQSVTISDATTGAAIYYTTNGSTPTTSSTKYSGAITVSSSETLNAIALATGDAQSAVASAAYTIAAAPSATSKAASSIGNTGATLNGTVTANNATTQYWFAYGTSSTSLTSTTTATGGVTGTSAKSVSATLTGLRATTTYYFQVVASNAVGTTSGAVLSFTTK